MSLALDTLDAMILETAEAANSAALVARDFGFDRYGMGEGPGRRLLVLREARNAVMQAEMEHLESRS